MNNNSQIESPYRVGGHTQVQVELFGDVDSRQFMHFSHSVPVESMDEKSGVECNDYRVS
jgi:hypothetical protein